MKKAVMAPIHNDYSDPGNLLNLARTAELAGWDGIFLGDHMLLDPNGYIPLVDCTVMLSAIAAVTEKIVFGPMVTPLSRRRPWKVARELATLDKLSNGRIRFGVGLGGGDHEFTSFGEDPNKKVLAGKTDEALGIIEQFLKGDTVHVDGKNFKISEVKLLPNAVQTPRIPVWVAAMMPFKAGLRRASRWDGLLAQKIPDNFRPDATHFDLTDWFPEPNELREAVNEVMSLRQGNGPFDVIAYGVTFGIDTNAKNELIKSYQEVGATWWCDWLEGAPGSYPEMLNHVRSGPPS